MEWNWIIYSVYVTSDLPDIDVISVSHNHCDHLKYDTIEYLYNNSK